VAHVVRLQKKCDNFDASSRCPWTRLRVRKVRNRRKQIIIVIFTRMDQYALDLDIIFRPSLFYFAYKKKDFAQSKNLTRYRK